MADLKWTGARRDSSPNNSLLDCLSMVDLKLFSQLQAFSIIGFFLASALAYILLKFQSSEVLDVLFNNEICAMIFGHIRFDYDYFALSKNAASAPRVWITEFVISIVAILSSVFLLLSAIWIRRKFLKSKINNIRLFSAAHNSSLILTIFSVWSLYSGFSRNLILGNYRVAFGPNDMAIFFFFCSVGIIVAVLFGTMSSIVILVFKLFKFLRNSGDKNAT